MSLIDVVVPTNLEKINWLEQSIESIINQKNIKKVLLIVDLKSVSLIKKIKFSHKKVEIIKSEGFGIAAGINTGIKMSDAHYIARQDDDDISSPNRFEVQLDLLKSSNSNMVFGSMELIDKNGNLIKNDAHMYQVNYFIPDTLIFRSFLNHATMLVESNKLKKTNLYPTNIHQEDYGFWLQNINNFKVALVTKTIYFYRQHDMQWTKNFNKQNNLKYCDNLFIHWKNFGQQLGLPQELLNKDNFLAIRYNFESHNSLFQLFGCVLKNIGMSKDLFWFKKVVDFVLNLNIYQGEIFDFYNQLDLNEFLKKDLFNTLLHQAQLDRKLLNELGSIAFNLTQKVENLEKRKIKTTLKLLKSKFKY